MRVTGGDGLSGTVDSLLFNGANSRILVRIDGGRLVEVADAGQTAAVSEGASVTVGFDPDRARVFARRPG